MKRSRHGLGAPMVRVNLRGFRALDRRTVAARSAMEWRAELIADLGGEQALSAARMALVDSASRSWLFIQHVDCWLLEQTSLVNQRRKALIPVLRERANLVEQLQRALMALGLDRQAGASEQERLLADLDRRLVRSPQAEPEAETGGHAAAGGVESALGVSEPGQAGGNEPAEDPIPEPEAGPVTAPVAAEVAEAAASRR